MDVAHSDGRTGPTDGTFLQRPHTVTIATGQNSLPSVVSELRVMRAAADLCDKRAVRGTVNLLDYR